MNLLFVLKQCRLCRENGAQKFDAQTYTQCPNIMIFWPSKNTF
jgi:hypothetical protein